MSQTPVQVAVLSSDAVVSVASEAVVVIVVIVVIVVH